MRTTKSKIVVVLALALVTVSGVAAWVIGTTNAVAGERSAREQVEELLPRLRSDESTVRERAEKELFALGEAGRREMERMSRDKDPVRAVLALRLLQSNAWRDATDERPLERQSTAGSTEQRMDDIEETIDRRFEELRQRLEQSLGGLRHWRVPNLGPDDDTTAGAQTETTVQGSVTRDGETLTWRRDPSGKLRVTVKRGDDEEKVVEADSEKAFRSEEPELAKELDGVVPGWSGGRSQLGFGGHFGFDVPWPHDLLDRLWHDPQTTRAPRGPTRILPPASASTPTPPVLGLTYDPPSDVLRAQLRLTQGGMVVRSVLPGTPAERLGIRPLDVLVRLAGHDVNDGPDVRAALDGVAEKDIVAEVIRAGEHVRLP